MRARRSAIALIAMLLYVASAVGFASTSFEQLLQEADSVRSSDPKRFGVLLDELDAQSEHAQPLQRQRLQYLHAYSAAVYGPDLAPAIADAQALLAQTSDIDLKFRTGSLIANLYALNRNFGEGLRYLDQALAVRHQVVKKEIRHDGINAAAMLYNQLGQYKLGLNRAEETLSDNPNPRAHCLASYFRIDALFRLGRLPNDDAKIESVIQRCAAINEDFAANFSRFVLARKWAAQDRHGDAIKLLQANVVEVESTGYARLIGEIHSLLAELYFATGSFGKAESHAHAAIKKSASIANSLPLVMAYKVLYDIAQLRHDPVAALSHYRSYAEADKAYLNEVKARELIYQIARQENAQKSQQIDLLNQQNEVLKLQQRVDQQSTQNTRLMVVVLLLLVGLIGYWAYKVKRLHLSLRRFAETDALTGISNRHHFTQQSEQSLARCEKAGEPAALVMFDLDHFKAINDAFGHSTGDWVLKQVAESCQTFCRRIDHLGRIGGEEFAILLHGCDLQAATRLAEDCRVRLGRIDTRDSGHSFSITASFGVSAASLSGYRLPDLMSHADQMLYRAKREGRDRVRAYARDVPIASQLQAVESS